MENLPVSPYTLCDDARRALASIKAEDFKPTSDLFKTLADPARIKILESLGFQELCVCVLVDVTGLQYSALSYHLKQLKDMGLVLSSKDGNFLIYSLTTKGKVVQEFISRSRELR